MRCSVVLPRITKTAPALTEQGRSVCQERAPDGSGGFEEDDGALECVGASIVAPTQDDTVSYSVIARPCGMF